MLAEIGKPLDIVILLQVSDDVATGRLHTRALAEGRADDAPDAIRNRLRLYHELTEPLIGRYREDGLVVAVDGEGSVDQVGADDRRCSVRNGGSVRMIIRKSEREIDKIAAAGSVVAETIAHVGSLIVPGITHGRAGRRGRRVHPRARRHSDLPGLWPAGREYPGAICISPNEVVVHGIPGAYEVSDGDLVTLDVGVTLDGYIADSAYTFGVGEVEPVAQRLMDVAQDALEAGIEQAQVGNRVGDISRAVQTTVESAGFSVVRSLVGHGVGRYYHEDPHIPNFGEAGRGPRLSEGMTIAIEPMITAGAAEVAVSRRRLDDLDGRRIPRRPLRAHGRDHADGPRILTPRVGVPARGKAGGGVLG